LPISVHSNVWVEPEHFTIPYAGVFVGRHDFFQTCLVPETVGKCSILDLEPVVDSDRFTSFGLPGSGYKRQGG